MRAEIWTGKKGLVFHRGEREKVKEIWRAEMENFREGKEAGNRGVCVRMNILQGVRTTPPFSH